VRASAAAEREEDQKREIAFQKARDELAEQLRRTQAQVRSEEQQSEFLDTRYGENDVEIEILGERLTDRLGQMGELFGVVRLVSTDTSAQAWASLTSAGLEGRTKLLDRLGRSSDLPSTEDLESLWFELQREMTEQGRIARMSLPVITRRKQAGKKAETVIREVVRVGPFTAFSEEGYVQWTRDAQMVRELKRQPPPRYLDTVGAYLEEGSGFQRVAIDPSRGVLLEALTDTPSILERTEQGGYVGYTIIGLGLFALALGLTRLAVLIVIGRRVEEQVHDDRPDERNPLGRVLGVYEKNRALDIEALELKLDEVVLRESTAVQQHMWIVQTISIIAPLLGLLGTVTGMIQTFQAITLFGAGDPKMMAGGISEALVTTTLGLVIAIPLVLLHALLSSRTRRITDLLDERSSALRATRLEEVLS
jgi:biopolymer transport protein ExbB